MDSFKFVGFDIEANGFTPTEIFCICMTDLLTGEERTYGQDEIAEACLVLEGAEMLVGHYIRGYDCPVIEKLTDGLIQFDRDKLVDTLDMSKALTSKAKGQKHSLKVWGNILGLPKLDSPLFEHYTPTMLPYCQRDVAITVKLFHHLLEIYLEGDRAVSFKNAEKLEEYFAALV